MFPASFKHFIPRNYVGGGNEKKYSARAIAGIVLRLLTSENILVNPHCGRWRKIQLQLKLNKTRSPEGAHRKRRRLDEGLASVSRSRPWVPSVARLPNTSVLTAVPS